MTSSGFNPAFIIFDLIFIPICGIIGHRKDRTVLGIILGLFGIIGLIVILIFPKSKKLKAQEAGQFAYPGGQPYMQGPYQYGAGVATGPGTGTPPPPGWYPDPQNPGQTRWWDGNTWTESVQPGHSPPPAPPAIS